MTEHEREHTGCPLGITRIFRPEFATLVIVVDLPKELAIDEFEAAEVVLSTGIIVPRELVKGRNELKCVRLSRGSVARRRHYGMVFRPNGISCFR